MPNDQFRRSRCLLIFSDSNGWVGFHFLSKKEFGLSSEIIAFLSSCSHWMDGESLINHATQTFGQYAEDVLEALKELNCLVCKGSKDAAQEVEYLDEWGWSLPSALLHCSVTGREVVPIEETLRLQREKIQFVPSPPLTRAHQQPDVRLPEWCGSEPLMALMEKRRTNRGSECRPMSLCVLSNALVASVGIRKWTTNGVCELPLKPTPSGGARNPFEVYVYNKNVAGLAEGYYHYSSTQHTLKSIANVKLESGSDLLGGQQWADNMSCIVLLVAHFDRTMWKYENDDNGYRVVMIEAGHIAQNMMLSATDSNVSVCPSAALNHNLIHERLNIQKLTTSAIYGLGFYPLEHTIE